MKHFVRALVGIGFGAGMALGSTVAYADPIGTTDNPCVNDSCFGNIYTLSYSEVSPTDFTIFLTIDTTSTTLATTDYVAQVAFKPVSSSSDITSATLTSTTAPGNWGPPTLGGLGNSGCTIGSQGFVCTTDGNSALTDGSTYQWVFDVQVTDATQWLLATDAASIKVNFGPDNGTITSENITLQSSGGPPASGQMPEPNASSLALLGLGMIGATFVMRGRSRRG